ncbi:MAG: hypothetical protein MI739_11595 [Bacteroidales bacterium]|nr:hypothetical protein [Bacteroidales bacterium]
MIFPNKFIKYEESILFKMLRVLEICQDKDVVGISELYSLSENKFDGIDEFISSIDILYILDTIEIDFNTNQIRYVKAN